MTPRKKAFTLIELIMMIVLFSFGIGALLTAVYLVGQNVIVPYIRQTASELAEQELERVTSRRYSQVVNEGPTTYAAPFDNYSFRVVVGPVPVALANDPGMTQFKQVTITVNHSLVGDVRIVSVVTNN